MQICGLKLVESQLLASLAAANARSDASTLRAQQLSAALEVAAAAAAKSTPGSNAGTAPVILKHDDSQGCAASSNLAAEVARLQAQVLASDHAMYALQDQLLQAKQVSISCRGRQVPA